MGDSQAESGRSVKAAAMYRKSFKAHGSRFKERGREHASTGAWTRKENVNTSEFAARNVAARLVF